MKRLLAIADDVNVTMILNRYCERLPDVTFFSYQSGAAALQIFEELQPDAIFIDYRLSGGLNGAQVVAMLQRQDPDLPCIAMTVDAPDDPNLQAFRRSCHHQLDKPIARHNFQQFVGELFPELA